MAEYLIVAAAVVAALAFIVRQVYRASAKDEPGCCTSKGSSCPSCGSRNSAPKGSRLEPRSPRTS